MQRSRPPSVSTGCYEPHFRASPCQGQALLRVKAVEAEQARDHERLDSLLEVFRSLGRGDERVAEMLRQSRLL